MLNNGKDALASTIMLYLLDVPDFWLADEYRINNHIDNSGNRLKIAREHAVTLANMIRSNV